MRLLVNCRACLTYDNPNIEIQPAPAQKKSPLTFTHAAAAICIIGIAAAVAGAIISFPQAGIEKDALREAASESFDITLDDDQVAQLASNDFVIVQEEGRIVAVSYAIDDRGTAEEPNLIVFAQVSTD